MLARKRPFTREQPSLSDLAKLIVLAEAIALYTGSFGRVVSTGGNLMAKETFRF